MILEANKNTFSESKIVLQSTIVASKVRIIPYSKHPRTVCMRVELLGCLEETLKEYNEALEEYTDKEIQKIYEEEGIQDNSADKKEVDIYVGSDESVKTTE